MTKLAPEWVRTNDPVIRSPARYRWTTAPAPEYARGMLLISRVRWSYAGMQVYRTASILIAHL